jgi:hypothetical protein
MLWVQPLRRRQRIWGSQSLRLIRMRPALRARSPLPSLSHECPLIQALQTLPLQRWVPPPPPPQPSLCRSRSPPHRRTRACSFSSAIGTPETHLFCALSLADRVTLRVRRLGDVFDVFRAHSVPYVELKVYDSILNTKLKPPVMPAPPPATTPSSAAGCSASSGQTPHILVFFSPSGLDAVQQSIQYFDSLPPTATSTSTSSSASDSKSSTPTTTLELWQRPLRVAIGPTTAKAMNARGAQWHAHAFAAKPTPQTLLEACLTLFQAQPPATNSSAASPSTAAASVALAPSASTAISCVSKSN